MELQYRERIIFLGQYIDEEFGNQVVATMLYLDSIENTKPMFLYINSPGGDVSAKALFQFVNQWLSLQYCDCLLYLRNANMSIDVNADSLTDGICSLGGISSGKWELLLFYPFCS